MKGRGVPDLPAGEDATPAANEEEFTATVKPVNGFAHAPTGWDPYEVWRTRVKGAPETLPEDAGDRLDPLA